MAASLAGRWSLRALRQGGNLCYDACVSTPCMSTPCMERMTSSELGRQKLARKLQAQGFVCLGRELGPSGLIEYLNAQRSHAVRLLHKAGLVGVSGCGMHLEVSDTRCKLVRTQATWNELWVHRDILEAVLAWDALSRLGKELR